jgi:hypothetical protein
MPNGTAGAGTAAAAGVGLRASSTIVAARCAKTKHCLVFMFPYGSPPFSACLEKPSFPSSKGNF